VEPRYDQLTLNLDDRHNKLQQVLSPNPDDAGVWIHQDAWFNLGKFDAGVSTDYTIHKPGNGVYAFVLSGEVQIDGQAVGSRDALGIWDTGAFTISASTDAEFLLMEMPMSF
jgi:redox-sensitive bicupin YhaK (pirin superfamily)